MFLNLFQARLVVPLYIPVHFMYWTGFQLARASKVQYNTDYVRQNDTVRQIIDPLLVTFSDYLLCGYGSKTKFNEY